jgi:hypothetical protein
MTLANTQYAEAITKVGGYYNFVTLINRRLKELNNGQPPMVQPPAGEKNWDRIDLIVKEIEQGLLTLVGSGTTLTPPAAPAAST